MADGATGCVIGAATSSGTGLVVVAGNAGDGVEVYAAGVTVRNALIGAGLSGTQGGGTVAVANGGAGIHIGEGALGTTVCNSTISGNAGSGIVIEGRNTTVTGNTIGLDMRRLHPVGNHGNGISIPSLALGEVRIGSVDSYEDKNTLGGNSLLAFSIAMPGLYRSNLVPARYSPSSPLGNGRELGVCLRCSCCPRNATSAVGATTGAPDQPQAVVYEVDCRPLNVDGRLAHNTCKRTHARHGDAPSLSVPLGNSPLTLFPANASIVRLSGGRQLGLMEWGELAATGPSLEVLDLSGNPRLDSIPPGGAFGIKPKFLRLAVLRIAQTNLSRLRDNTFQSMNRAALVELDLSQPSQPGGAPHLAVAVNLTGFANLSVVSWYNTICPKGFYAASRTPTRSDYTLCARCPAGTYSPGPGGVGKDTSCRPCAKGYFDLDTDPTTPCTQPPEPFTVVNFTRVAPTARRTGGGAQLITDQQPRLTYTVGVPYEFAPVAVSCTGGAGGEDCLHGHAITFTKTETRVVAPGSAEVTTQLAAGAASDAVGPIGAASTSAGLGTGVGPAASTGDSGGVRSVDSSGGGDSSEPGASAFLIDPVSGVMLGTPTSAGSFNITLYVRNDVGEQGAVQTITVVAVDPAPDALPQPPVLYIAVAAVCAVALLGVVGTRWRERRARNQPFDFKSIIAQMREDGLLGSDTGTAVGGPNVGVSMQQPGPHTAGAMADGIPMDVLPRQRQWSVTSSASHGSDGSDAPLVGAADTDAGPICSGAAWSQTRRATGTASSSEDSTSAASNSSKGGRASVGTTSAARSTRGNQRGVTSKESTSHHRHHQHAPSSRTTVGLDESFVDVDSRNTCTVKPREVSSQCLTMLGRLGAGAFGDV